MNITQIENNLSKLIKNFNLETFKAQTSEELIARYNSSVKTGIVGVYAQAIMLVALR